MAVEQNSLEKPLVETVKTSNDAVKPKVDDSYSHALSVFAQSLAYSGVEAPVRAVAQVYDHFFTTNCDQTVQKKFANAGIEKPERAAYGTKAWTAQLMGQGLGTLYPMHLSREIMVGKAVHTGVASSLAEQAWRDGKVSSKMGLFNGAILTPTDNNDPNSNFWKDRAKQGFNSFVSFHAMGISSSLTGGALGKMANSLESTALPDTLKASAQAVLRSGYIHGVISGVPGGAIQAQLNAMENGEKVASKQEFKESIASMIFIGGTVGNAGFLREAAAKDYLKTDAEFRLTVPVSRPGNGESERFNSSKDKPAHPFDIKFAPIKEAWSPDVVGKHTTIENRTFEFKPENRDKQLAGKDWSKFDQWGVEKRDVPTHVYKFPGLNTEIVVPSEYAAVLDKVRQERLNPGTLDRRDPENAAAIYRGDRILPEEMAQMLTRLPQPDLAKSVQLLDHENPWDAKRNYDRKVAAQEKGEKVTDADSIALATANTGSGTIKVHDVVFHDEPEIHWVTTHEFAHLLEKDPAFKAFDAAAYAERDGHFTRKYARENTRENWAVHTGEDFLDPDGATFAKLPEEAPARTLVIAKAIRNMLKEREANPGPNHQQFLDRVNAAETLATTNLRKGIVSDLAKGDYDAVADKLKFLNTAATAGQSPEILENVIAPISRDLIPITQTVGAVGREARRALSDLIATRSVNQSLGRSMTSPFTPMKF